MSKHLKYLKYLVRHKWFVLIAGIKVGAGFWRLIKHDWTKFLPSEWFPYVESFYGGYSHKERPKHVVTAFDRAWNAHQKRNDHHWQYYLLILDKPKGKFTYVKGDSDINSAEIRVMDWTRKEQLASNKDAPGAKHWKYDVLCTVPIGVGDGYKMLEQAHDKVDLITQSVNSRPIPLVMPEAAIREMVADWAGAGKAITGKWEVVEWYKKNKENMLLHPETRERVEELLIFFQ